MYAHVQHFPETRLDLRIRTKSYNELHSSLNCPSESLLAGAVGLAALRYSS